MAKPGPFFWWSLVGTMAIATLPYALGWAMTPTGATFYGNHVVAPADFSIYYSYINQGRQGHLWMYDAFTSEPHRATLFQPLWFLVGLTARLLHLGAPAAFALARTLAIPVLAWTLWWAAGWLWPGDEAKRRLGFILTIIASGLGGIVVATTNSTLTGNIWTYPDLWVSEAYTVLTLWSSAHFVLVTAGIIFVLIAVERSWLEQRWWWAWWAGLVAMAVVSIHPFHVITWAVAWLILTVWRWTRRRRFPWRYAAGWMMVLVMLGPILLLYGLQLFFDPLTIGRAVQNINSTATPWDVAIGLGLMLISAVAGVWLWRLRDERWRWVVTLAVAYLIAIYLPVAFQRRLSQGMMLPIAWLSVPTATTVFAVIRRRMGSAASMAIIALALVTSSTWIVIGGVMVKDYLTDLSIPRRMYYIDAEHRALYSWLNHTDPHQPLFATLIESNVAAGLTAHQVYVAYGVETLDYSRKLLTMQHFFTNMPLASQRRLLTRERLCYVLTSPRSRAYGPAFQPERWPELKRIWSSPTLALYQTPYCR